MKFSILTSLALSVSALATRDVNIRRSPSPDTTIEDATQKVNNLARKALHQALATITENSDAKLTGRATTCTSKNVSVRKEWGALTKAERTAYITAVKCLQAKPPKTPTSVAPGARSRFDDFVGAHINQTLTIHWTGTFLVWHRYYVWQYEKALREECGFGGTQPYWDWAKTAVTGLHASPIFDGSDTSLSGDGEYIPNQGQIILFGNNSLPGFTPVYLDAGTGGGCIKSGPFKGLQVNMGPVGLSVPGDVATVSNPAGPLAYNPRCVKRSLTDQSNRDFANASSVLSLLTRNDDVLGFQTEMQGLPGNIGVHGGGHYALGGDPGRDAWVSPGDPAFYLHHGMIDRAWWLWQTLKPSERTSGPKALSGTNTFLNMPPSANTTYQDFIDLGYAAGPSRQIKDLMSTTAGPFCYVYA
ncbi:hypothetical protein F5Y17DRAFT_441247 [Xylariaceae sp. FL0594]|nr:hypothetical protein F5Y17DRAFT_441247 [Xylariaceae sp. FL0594]